jgi:hypothetical protein
LNVSLFQESNKVSDVPVGLIDQSDVRLPSEDKDAVLAVLASMTMDCTYLTRIHVNYQV